jgi:hypothetical protein
LGEENCRKFLFGKPETERHLGEIGLDGRTILILIGKNGVGGHGLE